MDHSGRSLDGLLVPSAGERYIQMLTGEGQLLNISETIRMDVAVQALQEGYSLTEIVQEAVRQLEKVIIEHVLDATQGNKAEAARVLQIDYKTLYRKMYRLFGAFSDIAITPEEDHSAEP
jgi:DNA-binding NtrC family response regulator